MFRSSTAAARAAVRLSAVAAAAAVWIAAAPAAPSAATAPPDSPAARARDALDRFPEARRAPDLREGVRTDLLSAAEALHAAGADSLGAICLDCAGILSFSSGRIDEAQESWARAVERAEALGEPGLVARCLNSRAVGFAVTGDYERAARMFRAQIPVREAIGDVGRLGTVWANLANACHQLGRIPECIEARETALRYHLEAGEPRGLSAIYGSLADVLVDVENLPQALAWADSSVAIGRRYELPEAIGHGLIKRAKAELADGRPEDAVASLDEALDVFTRNESAYYAAWTRVERGLPLLRLGRAGEFLASMRDARADLAAIEDPTLHVMRRTLEGFALLDTGADAAAESLLTVTLRDFEGYGATLQDEPSRATAALQRGETVAALARALVRRGDAEGAWALAERGCRERLARGKNDVDAVALDDLRDALRRENAALVHLLDPESGPRLVFTVTGDGLRAHESDGRGDLGRRLRPVLDLLASGADDAACAPALARLAEELLPGLLDGLPDGVERLVVVAPNRLSGFPLEALPLPDGRPLGERWLVTYVPSATTWTTLRDAPETGVGMIALADPAAGAYAEDPNESPRVRSLRGTPLPHAREEALAIAKGGAVVLAGADATVGGATGNAARDAAVLHFATHADVNPLRADRSALLLADGDLDAAAIRDLRLHADLVTLSGCRTGGGYALLGEGSLGLASAFLGAGARSVVGSAWDVEDRAARAFMTALYDALREGKPRDAALREARRATEAAGLPPRDRYAFVLAGFGNAPVPALAAPRTGVPRGAVAVVLALVSIAVFGLARRRSAGV